jgi:hypothetical protein
MKVMNKGINAYDEQNCGEGESSKIIPCYTGTCCSSDYTTTPNICT